MKYALLVFGIVLMIGGAFSIYSGSGIIEMERGWASVLAGATAVAGGAITIGLAWILRTLEQIRAALETGAARPSTELNRIANEPFVEIPDVTEPASANVERPPPEPAPAPAVAEAAEPNVQAPEAAEANVVEAQADAHVPPPPLAAELPESAPAPAVETPAPSAKIRRLPRATTAFVEGASAKTPTADSSSIDELWQRVATDMGSMRLGQAPNSPRPKPEPAAGDWLDRALAALESTDADQQADTGQQATEPEQAPPLMPETEQHSEPQPKIVGRYAADGTVYVMFSDGSIEAQLAQGVYRFASMAELKAYFEA